MLLKQYGRALVKPRLSQDVMKFDLEKTFRVLRGSIRPKIGQFFSLPLASIAGVRIDSVDSNSAIVSLPGGWRTQNPFRSTYWAAQGMAAEMSTGLIPLAYVKSAPVPIRMILAGTSARFVKMCQGRSVFRHNAGSAVQEAMAETFRSGKSVECELSSVGYDESGDVVSDWSFIWSFRARLSDQL